MFECKVPRSRCSWFVEVSLDARAATNRHCELQSYPKNRFVYACVGVGVGERGGEVAEIRKRKEESAQEE